MKIEVTRILFRFIIVICDPDIIVCMYLTFHISISMGIPAQVTFLFESLKVRKKPKYNSNKCFVIDIYILTFVHDIKSFYIYTYIKYDISYI